MQETPEEPSLLHGADGAGIAIRQGKYLAHGTSASDHALLDRDPPHRKLVRGEGCLGLDSSTAYEVVLRLVKRAMSHSVVSSDGSQAPHGGHKRLKDTPYAPLLARSRMTLCESTT